MGRRACHVMPFDSMYNGVFLKNADYLSTSSLGRFPRHPAARDKATLEAGHAFMELGD